MVSVFLSHSSQDNAFVRELAGALEVGGEIEVRWDERDLAPGDNVVSRIAEGLESDFVLVVVSPESVDSKWVQREWADALHEETTTGRKKVLVAHHRDCRIPPLLSSAKYFDLRKNRAEGFRQIRSFLLTERTGTPARVNYLPVRPPIFVGREKELAELRKRLAIPGALVHVTGIAGKGKTALALQFAHEYQQDFEGVFWLPCQSSSVASIASELARQLGIKLEGDLPEVLRELKGICAAKRYLLIFDNVEDESAGELIPGGIASVLVTTRHMNLKFLRLRDPAPLPYFSEDQCFDFFRQELGQDVDRHTEECRTLFRRLGYLPIAVSVSAALIREDVRYTIPGLAQNVPGDVTALIREAIEALDAEPRKLLAAISACAAEGFFLDLAAEVGEFDESQSLNALHQLSSRSLVEELSRMDRRYRLHALVRQVSKDDTFMERHAEVVVARFKNWEKNWKRCEAELADFQAALEWDIGARNHSRAHEHANCGFLLLERVGRFQEGFDLSARMRTLAASDGANAFEAKWLYRTSWIFRSWGRWEEAMSLLKQQEAISLALNDRDGLQRSYGGQATLLDDSGHHDQAMELLRKQEQICLELGNKEALAECYGLQAAVFQGADNAEEGMAIYKKQEALCLAIGQNLGLQRCYGNQALILTAMGKFDEAFALHQKQEAICLELGAKRELAYCWGQWGVLERSRGNCEQAVTKLTAALDLFSALGMPRERNAVQEELDKARGQAS